LQKASYLGRIAKLAKGKHKPCGAEEDPMGKSTEVVNRFYEICNDRQGEGLEALVARDVVFEGPLMRLAGAEEYVSTVRPFLKFHKGVRMLKQFEDGGHVCSIYEMTLGTPAGGALTLVLADWIRIADGRVAEQKLYYDPREFAKAFMP
jgi:ketosteroid isomerase-like protein